MHLPPDGASITRDILMQLDPTDHIGNLKKKLIARSAESSQPETWQLQSGDELGNRKPSYLMRSMKRRSE